MINCNSVRLPFVEKFRPKTLNDIISHEDIIITLKNLIVQHNVPHMMFYGPPGTGKTSTIEAFVKDLYGIENVKYMTMNINASEERGIEIVRNKIKNFVLTLPIINTSASSPKYKFVILDEADAMTQDAQAMLKQVIEYYTYNARFCLICNCIKKINTAIQSRCTTFKFSPLNFDSVKNKINLISNEANIKITQGGIHTIWKLSNGDMRKVMHMLQVMTINNNYINSDTVLAIQKYPSKHDSKKIFKSLMNDSLHDSLKKIKKIIKLKCYSINDIILEMTHMLIDNIINKQIDPSLGGKILSNMKNIEMNIIVTSDTYIQLCSLVSIFKSFI